jgi:hypothetical protein
MPSVSPATIHGKHRRREGAPAVSCTRCSRETDEPRKGLCPGCYQDDYHGRTLGPACEACDKGEARVLGRRSIGGIYRTLCGDCERILGRRRITIDALRMEVRPAPHDRRQGGRRTGDRRGPGRRAPSWQSGAALHLGEELRDAEAPGRRATDG